MTKNSYIASRQHFTLSELSEEKIISLLEHFPSDPESYTRPEGEPLPTIGEIRETESQLFTQIVSAMSETSIPYGQAVLLLAIYATTIEDRVRIALIS